jgi:hypothetical protein
MVMVPTNGSTAECTTEATRTIRRMDSVFTYGQTVVLTLETGLKANKMTKEFMSYLMALFAKVSGKVIPENSGSRLQKKRRKSSRLSSLRPSSVQRMSNFNAKQLRMRWKASSKVKI